MEEIKRNIQDFYLNNGKVCYQHDNNRIIGKLRSFEFKKNKMGKNGMHVVVELYPGNNDIEKDILNGTLKGFSWSLFATRNKNVRVTNVSKI